MKVSVVIPTYHRPQLLLRCIEALRNQTFNAGTFEIIIVSDGPDEKTKTAINDLKKDAPLIRFISLAEKKGPAAARNLGWNSSRAKLIAFTDDDCIPDRSWLSSLWNAFLRAPGNKVAFSGRTIVPISKNPTDYERNISHLADAEFITANCACTLSALQKVNGFDEEFTMAWREDSDLQFKFLENNIPICKVENAVVTHPVRKAPWGVSIKDEKKGIFNALLYKKYPGLYKKRIQSSPPWHYYVIVCSMASFLCGIFVNHPGLTWVSFIVWLSITGWFTIRRLKNTSRRFEHISEMAITSMIIPFLSIFYRIYGALKFKSPLIP
jgi:glycosyltransferase involved in cell wall biosynthesis